MTCPQRPAVLDALFGVRLDTCDPLAEARPHPLAHQLYAITTAGGHKA